MAASAAFHFDSQASLLKKSATPAGTVTLTLDSVTGVDSILWTVALTCENSAGDWTISGSTANNATLTVPNVSGIACIIQCRVNGGTRVDPTTGVQSVGDLVKTAKVYTGAEVIVTGETTESDATYGWAPVVNAALATSGVSLSNVAPSAVGTASAGVGADASRYDHVHAHGNQLGGTLHADASGAAAGFMSAANYTTLTSAAEAPTVSVIPVRSSAGRLRGVSYSLETNTDGDRVVHALQADAATYDTLGLKTTALAVTDGTGAYGQTYTPAAAATLTYGTDLASLVDSIGQAAAGAGAYRRTLSALGASGSAPGQCDIGVPHSGTALLSGTGGLRGLLGSEVANVSNRFSLVTGDPAAATTVFQAYKWSSTAFVLRTGPGDGTATSGLLNLDLAAAQIVFRAAGLQQYIATTGVYLTPGSGQVTTCQNNGIENEGSYSNAPNSVAFAASTTLNCSLSDHHIIGAMTANITTLTMSNVRAGSTFTVKVLQDGTGSWTIAWNGSFKFGAAYSNVPKTAANSVTLWRFFAEGTTTWRCIGREEYTS